MGLGNWLKGVQTKRATAKAQRQFETEQKQISDTLREYDTLSSTLLDTIMDTEKLAELHNTYIREKQIKGKVNEARIELQGKLAEVYDASGWSMPDEQLILSGETPGGKSTLTELYERAIEHRVETVEENGQYGLAHLISAGTTIKNSKHEHTIEGLPLTQRVNTILTNLSLFLSRHKTNGSGKKNLGQTLTYLLKTGSGGETLAEELAVLYEGDNPGEQVKHEATRTIINKTNIPARSYEAAEMVIAGHTSRGLNQTTTYTPPEDTTKESPSVTTLVQADAEIAQRLGPYISALSQLGFSAEFLPVSDDVFTIPTRHGIVCLEGMKDYKDHRKGDLMQTIDIINKTTSCIKNQTTREGFKAQVQTLVTEGAQERYKEFTDAEGLMQEAIADESENDSTTAAVKHIDDRIRVGEIALTYANAIVDIETKKPIIGETIKQLVEYQRSAIGILEKEVGSLQETDNGPSLELTVENPDKLLTLYSQIAKRYSAISDKKQAGQYTALATARVFHAEEGRLQEIEDSADGLTSEQCLRLSTVYAELGKQHVALGNRETAETYLRDARSQRDEAEELETREHAAAHDATLQVGEPGQSVNYAEQGDGWGSVNHQSPVFDTSVVGFENIGLGPDTNGEPDDTPDQTE
jgi:hypothetical protein